MLIAIVQHTPVWVWFVLAALVAMGLAQARSRTVGLARITLLPLALTALSAAGVLSAFGHGPLAFGAWAAGIGAAVLFARQAVAVRGASWDPAAATLRVPGSWLPLGLMLGLFVIKFLVGFNLAQSPALAADPAFSGTCALAYGGFAGVFLARSLSLRSLARSPRLAPAA